jgi:hypothetical protein
MKKIPSLLLPLVLLLAGCSSMQTGSRQSLVGSWKNSLGTVWTVRADHTFDVDLNQDGKRDAWGTYAISGDEITITDTKGKTPKGCKDPATYRFVRKGEALEFKLVKDACKLRIKNVLADWHRA